MNPIELVKKFMGVNMNPQEFIMKNMLGNNQNPMINNLINMAQNGNNESVEKFARNIFNEKGRDFDKEFSAFMKQFKG